MIITPELSIIVVSYNTRDMTLACLRSVIEETRTPYELIVVDNASHDGSAEAIHKEFPNVLLLKEIRNHGFAAANNLAVQHTSADHILLLNPDTVILDHAIDRLFAFAKEQPRARIWGGRTLFEDYSLNSKSCWSRMTLWTLFCQTAGLSRLLSKSPTFNSEAYGGWERDTVREVDIITGCLLLISRNDWIALGGFNEEFFMYGEEADLCLRAQSLLGARPKFTPNARIIHYGGASERVQADKMVKLLAAKMQLIERHFKKWQKPLAKILLIAWPGTRALALNLSKYSSIKANPWKEIWARRAEWQHGFPKLK